MNDMSGVIAPKSDQINADDLIAGPRTIIVAGVDIRPGTEQPVSIRIDGDGKVFRPCKSMSRVLVAGWGPDARQYVGRAITLYRDPTVKWGGMEVGGIRISHLSDIEREMVMALTATKGKRTPYSVKPLARGEPAPATMTLEQARQSLLDAADLDQLRAAWSRRPMAPYREQLSETLTNRKAELEDLDGEQSTRGETTTLASAIAEIDRCELVVDVNTRVAALLPLLSDDDGAALREHAMARIAALKVAA